MALPSGETHVIQVRNTTPLLVGWYEPTKSDPIGLRPSEIKGVWNWWARAFIAGAMYDLGLLHGRKDRNVLLRPRKEEAKALACIIGKVLGLGYVGEAGSEASRFTMYTELAVPGSIAPKRFRDSLQRVRLLSLGDRAIEGYDRGVSFRIVVKKRVSRYQAEELTALKILVASLELSGVGKGARRGLGSLDVKPPDVVKERSIKSLIDDIYKECVEIVERARDRRYEECARFFEELKGAERSATLPPLPCMSKRSIEGLNVSQVLLVRGVGFTALHNFFVRAERCRVLTGSTVCNDDLRGALAAWILGLPRGRERGERSGYLIGARDVSRRASPIILSYHERFNAYGDGAYITILASGDWPAQLEWTNGAVSQAINVDFETLISAYRVAIGELESYLKKLNASVQRVWP
jgi:CRISPR-associated protein Cmr1